ncbi:nematocyst expressed protein 4-like [Pungitius pungitius]|uniref:nematocyst expressed protein 4-like n=1 Tax=Pungitius pungitius TaxID=134920 RepID=UPI002E0ED79C
MVTFPRGHLSAAGLPEFTSAVELDECSCVERVEQSEARYCGNLLADNNCWRTECYSNTNECYSNTNECYSNTNECYSNTNECYCNTNECYSNTNECYVEEAKSSSGPPAMEPLLSRVRQWILAFGLWHQFADRPVVERPLHDVVLPDYEEDEEEGVDELQEVEAEPPSGDGQQVPLPPPYAAPFAPPYPAPFAPPYPAPFPSPYPAPFAPPYAVPFAPPYPAPFAPPYPAPFAPPYAVPFAPPYPAPSAPPYPAPSAPPYPAPFAPPYAYPFAAQAGGNVLHAHPHHPPAVFHADLFNDDGEDDNDDAGDDDDDDDDMNNEIDRMLERYRLGLPDEEEVFDGEGEFPFLVPVLDIEDIGPVPPEDSFDELLDADVLESPSGLDFSTKQPREESDGEESAAKRARW